MRTVSVSPGDESNQMLWRRKTSKIVGWARSGWRVDAFIDEDVVNMLVEHAQNDTFYAYEKAAEDYRHGSLGRHRGTSHVSFVFGMAS